jgi:hypothetical protein
MASMGRNDTHFGPASIRQIQEHAFPKFFMLNIVCHLLNDWLHNLFGFVGDRSESNNLVSHEVTLLG